MWCTEKIQSLCQDWMIIDQNTFKYHITISWKVWYEISLEMFCNVWKCQICESFVKIKPKTEYEGEILI